MGRHGAERLPVRELRSSYNRLLETYGRLLREHRRLEAEHWDLLGRVPVPSAGPALWRPSVWGDAAEAMSVDTAREMVRASGLLTSPGLEA